METIYDFKILLKIFNIKNDYININININFITHHLLVMVFLI